MSWGFLIPYAANPSMLEVCLHSIRRHYPDDKIIVSLRELDPFRDAGFHIALQNKAECVVVPGRGDETDWVMASLIDAADFENAVYMESDCCLVDSLGNIRKLGEQDSRALVGVEDVIGWPDGRPGFRFANGFFRYAPGYYTASFWAANIKQFKEELGTQKIHKVEKHGPPIESYEPYYGFFKAISDAGWHFHNLSVEDIGKPYGFAMLYGKSVIHTWFGARRLRDNVELASGVPMPYLAASESRFIADYWTHVERGNNAPFGNGLLTRGYLGTGRLW